MDIYDNYRLIEAAKVRGVKRIENGIQLTPEDVVVKIERNSDAENYYNGFVDYHGPGSYRDRYDDPDGRM